MACQMASAARGGCREGTEAFHRQAVERAVLAIRRRFAEEGLGLTAIAAEAISSPFHFARVFRRISGVPPCHFLTAVRMDAAKRLLVDTGLSVTNVCLEVGYTSLGTFTRRFTELVGFSPRMFRQIARSAPPVQASASAQPSSERPARGGAVSGEIAGPVSGPIAIGLFPTPLPQKRPVACCLAARPGPYRIGSVPDGRYFVLAADLGRWCCLSQEPEFRGIGAEPVTVSPETPTPRADILMRQKLITDPPILVSVPLLAAGFSGMRSRARLRRSAPAERREFSHAVLHATAADGTSRPERPHTPHPR